MIYRFKATGGYNMWDIEYDSYNDSLYLLLTTKKVPFILSKNGTSMISTTIGIVYIPNIINYPIINMGKTNNIGEMINFIKANERLEKIKYLRLTSK